MVSGGSIKIPKLFLLYYTEKKYDSTFLCDLIFD